MNSSADSTCDARMLRVRRISARCDRLGAGQGSERGRARSESHDTADNANYAMLAGFGLWTRERHGAVEEWKRWEDGVRGRGLLDWGWCC